MAGFKDLLGRLFRDDHAAAPAAAPGAVRLPRYVELYRQAEECDGRGDVARSCALLREALREAPDVAALHNRLGVLLALHVGDVVNAAHSIRRAVALEPDNVNYRANLQKVLALRPRDVAQ